MTEIRTDQIEALVQEKVKGTAIVTVDLEYPMDDTSKMTKGGNPFFGLGIVKRQTLNVVLGHSYINAVNRIALKEGKEEREAQENRIGPLDEKRLIRTSKKTGRKYLWAKLNNVLSSEFIMPDGTKLTAEEEAEIKSFVPKKISKSSTQSDLKGETKPQNYKLENIKEIRAWNDSFVINNVIQESEAEAVEAEAETVEA